MKKILIYIAVGMVALFALSSCIDDSIDTSGAAQPTFSVDCVDLGEVVTEKRTATHSMLIYNPNSKGLSISDIRLSGTDANCFRINVDGMAGTSFQDVEIRANDSIYVFIDGLFPKAGTPAGHEYRALLDVTVNGRVQQVPIVANGVDVTLLEALTVTGQQTLDAEYPYIVMDSLVVAPGATLTLLPGVKMRFHTGAALVVHGTLQALGTAQQPIDLTGDRTDNVVGDISFDLMSRQWEGVWFTPTSSDNLLSHTKIRNTVWGVAVDSVAASPALMLDNCILTNSGDVVMDVRHSHVQAWGTQFSEASNGLVRLHGGKGEFAQCTFANNYLFTAIMGPALAITHTGLKDDDDGSGMPFNSTSVVNSIIYGYGSELTPANIEGADIRLHRVLLKSAGTDDDNFTQCLWDADPLFYTVREDYLFDYRLKPESPAVGAADTAANPAWPWAAKADFYAVPRTDATMGAFQSYIPQE